eukprot:6200357-Pleurochrysis_carterae.AAC.9
MGTREARVHVHAAVRHDGTALLQQRSPRAGGQPAGGCLKELESTFGRDGERQMVTGPWTKSCSAMQAAFESARR